MIFVPRILPAFGLLLVLTILVCGHLVADSRLVNRTAGTFVDADLSDDRSRQVVIAQGTESVYNGHATLVRTRTGKMIAVWTIGHGGVCGPAAESTDDGKTWTRIDLRFPVEWTKSRNCPAIFSLGEYGGRERLMIFAQGRADGLRGCGRAMEMTRCLSEDDGLTWRVLEPIPVTCVMPLTTLISCRDGSLLGLYNDRWPESQRKRMTELGRKSFPWNRVAQIRSRDGGFTWSTGRIVAESETLNLCEPFVLRSDDGTELCCIMRDNAKPADVGKYTQSGFGTARSKMMFSRDEGVSWSEPVPTATKLTGHRHNGVRDSKGRWTIAFRDVDPESPYRGNYCCWRGTYDDIAKARPGQRLKLLHSNARNPYDCGYAATALLPDDTVFALTYIKYNPGSEKHSVVGCFIAPEIGVK